MNAALVGGCAVAGLAAGLLLDDVGGADPAGAAPSQVAEASSVAAANGLPAASPPFPRPRRPSLRGAGPARQPQSGWRPQSSPPCSSGWPRPVSVPSPALAAYCVLFCGLVAVSVADLRVGLVPRSFLYPTFVLMAGALVGRLRRRRPVDRPRPMPAISGGGAFVVFFAAVVVLSPRHRLRRRAAGRRDRGRPRMDLLRRALRRVRLGVSLRRGRRCRAHGARGHRSQDALAFGPPLALGAVVGVLWGPWVQHFWTAHP